MSFSGFPLELGDEESRVPVIVIQRPGVTDLSNTGSHAPNPGRGSGFDILLPKGWGMAFWVALVFRGARCAGLRERECNAHEEKSLLFPNDFPDTLSGQQYQVELEKEKVDKYNRMPPAKRSNYTKYGIVSPFYCPWELLVKEWNDLEDIVTEQNTGNKIFDSKLENKNGVISLTDEVQNVTDDVTKNDKRENTQVVAEQSLKCSKTCKFYVLRNAKVLRQLQSLCEIQNHRQRCKVNKADVLDVVGKDHTNAVVAVHLDMVQKGCPGQFSTICFPSTDDLEQLTKNRSYGGPVEPMHNDPVLIEKQKLKKEMKMKGVKGKAKVDRSLKLIGEKQGVTIRTQSRDVIGFLNSGGYSLGTGNGGGVGFVSSVGLIKLLRECLQSVREPVVLVRGNSTLQYRCARLSVVT